MLGYREWIRLTIVQYKLFATFESKLPIIACNIYIMFTSTVYNTFWELVYAHTATYPRISDDNQ